MRVPTLGPGPGSGLGNKWQSVMQVVRNLDTVTLPAGTPVVLSANGTEDGVAVVLPSTAASNQVSDLMIGIIGNSCAVSGFQDAVCYGMITNAKLVLGTRSASTAAWASYAAISVGDILAVETVNNGLSRSGSAGSGVQQAVYAAMQSFASATTQASSWTGPVAGAVTSVSGLYVPAKVFVRAM